MRCPWCLASSVGHPPPLRRLHGFSLPCLPSLVSGSGQSAPLSAPYGVGLGAAGDCPAAIVLFGMETALNYFSLELSEVFKILCKVLLASKTAVPCQKKEMSNC